MRTVTPQTFSSPDFAPILATLRPVVGMLAVSSGVINLLMLTSPLFMLQVYDRVLPSRSMPTLIGLFLLASVMIAAMGVFDWLRARVLTRIGIVVDERLGRRVLALLLRRDRRSGPRGDAVQCVRDLDTVRGFASGAALSAFFDLPWIVVYVAICFLFHPLMGWAVLAGVVCLCGLAFLTETMLRGPTEKALDAASQRRAFADTMRRNAGLLQALGMLGVMEDRWEVLNESCRRDQTRSADVASGFGSLLRCFRMLLQSALLALGAYLVIGKEATAGVMLAATILTVRALSPVEMLIANWKSFIGARQSLIRLAVALAETPTAAQVVPLPAPCRQLRMTSVSLMVAGRDAPVVHDVSFTLEAGSALGIVGPSGSGKSSLAKALVGLWPAARGVVRLDDAELDQWDVDALGCSIGYLPQDVELLPGTLAQNIARFREDDPRLLFDAAAKAGVHELILRMPNGYETQVGEGGALLSGGQRQRIALARALYGDPFVLVLDEPNSNLDSEGEAALAKAILSVRARGGIAVVVAHRPSALSAVDKLMVVNEGRMQAFGARDDVLARLSGPQPARAAPVGGAETQQTAVRTTPAARRVSRKGRVAYVEAAE